MSIASPSRNEINIMNQSKPSAPSKEDFTYQIIRSSRKTVSIQISPEGTVVVRCPRRLSVRAIQSFVEEKRPWIEKHLARRLAQPQLSPFTPEELRALAQQARQTFPERVAHYASLLGVTYGRITIRAQRSRWGSCSAKGNLNFNCLLMLAPPEVRDYVVVHELCHRLELNHSQRFWAWVERIVPDYKLHRKWLKDNGSSLIGRLSQGTAE